MGQDREYTQEQIKTALRTVRDFRDRWEQVEKENLEKDVLARLKSIHFDKDYKEHFEIVDQQELEKMVEENCAPKEGDDPLDEEAKAQLQRKIRFKLLTRGFHAPHEPKPPKKKKVKEDHHKTDSSSKEAKPGQNVSGVTSKNDTIESAHADQQPLYFPLKPEQWKKKIMAFQNYDVIKMPRVF